MSRRVCNLIIHITFSVLFVRILWHVHGFVARFMLAKLAIHIAYVAIKVARSIRGYRDAAMIEVDVLEQLAKNNKDIDVYFFSHTF